MDVKKAAAAERDYIVSVRREFHRHPELSNQEVETTRRIRRRNWTSSAFRTRA